MVDYIGKAGLTPDQAGTVPGLLGRDSLSAGDPVYVDVHVHSLVVKGAVQGLDKREIVPGAAVPGTAAVQAGAELNAVQG